MPESTIRNLSGVAETLLFPVYIRALESQRPDALLRDARAVALVGQNEADFARIRQIKMDDDDMVALVLRNRQFDRYARDFMARHADAVVVHIGCGLDSRFERVDDGRVDWYDLDLPEVIDLRREFIGGEGQRYHHLSYSAFDPAWTDKVTVSQRRPVLILAEGVLMYFKEEQIKSLVLTVRDRFAGAELVFDAFSPFLVRMNNFRFRVSRTRMTARYNWGLKRPKDLEGWGDGISLLSEWYPLDQTEPRLAHIQWMRRVPFLAKVMGIFRYRLDL